METFGRKLKQVVEARGLRLEEMAQATGLRIEQIQALQRDDFGDLREEDEAVRAGLVSFARLVDVDPDEVLADYRRERRRWLAGSAADLKARAGRDVLDGPVRIEPTGPPGGPRTAEAESESRSRHRLGIALVAVGMSAVLLIVFGLRSRPSTAPESNRPAAAVRNPERGGGTADESPAPSGVQAESDDLPAETPAGTSNPGEPVPAVARPIEASRLSVPEHGVGRRVVDHELVDEAERFVEGERVWFWTRIEGGVRGESVDHVWLLEGEEVRRVTLSLGGPRWRTHTYKNLDPGSAGSWIVEARDSTGRLLARRKFLCSPRP